MKNKFLILTILLTASFLFGAGQFEERILAVVDDRVITSSEVEVALMTEIGQLPSDSAQLMDLYRAKVEDLIDEELILIAAEQESLPVDDARVEEMFRSRWGLLVEGYGGEIALENALENEGYSVEEFRRKTREQIENFYLKQMFIQKHFGRIPVTESEVDSFYQMFRDSLPKAQVEVNLATILIFIEPDSSSIERALDVLRQARNKIESGDDFAKVAAEFSEDELTASSGGQLGTYTRGDLTPALDSLAFALKYGEVGGPVRSPMGYHLVKVTDKSGGRVTLAHILAKAPLTEERMLHLAEIADSVYNDASASSVDFSGLVAKYDETSSIEHEEIGWVPLAAIQGEFKNEISRAEVGDIIGPYEVGDYIQIVKLVDRREGRERTLDEDLELIREGARQMKAKEAIESRLERLREMYYIEIRI